MKTETPGVGTSPILSITSVEVSEASPYAVVVASLSDSSTEAISFLPSLEGMSATSGEDFSSTLQYFDQEAGEAGQWLDVDPELGVTFQPGQISILLRASLNNDDLFEGKEKLKVVSGKIQGEILNEEEDSIYGTIAIFDDGSCPNVFLEDNTSDEPTREEADDDRPLLSISSVEVSEASPYAVVVASLSNPSTEAISFLPSLKGRTATLDEDLASTLQYFDQEAGEAGEWLDIDAAPGVTFHPGQISFLLRASLNNDDLFEGKEKLKVVSGKIQGEILNEDDFVYGTIAIFDDGSCSNVFLEDNNSDEPTLEDADDDRPLLSISSVEVSEVSPYAVVVAYLSNPSTEAISFLPSLEGISATSGEDFSSTLQYFDQEAGEAGQWLDVDPELGVTFEPGSIEIQLRFAIYLDQITEEPEIVALITGPIEGTVVNPDGAEGTITIRNSAAYVSILSIEADTGISSSDFITNDTTLVVKGSNALLGLDEKVQIRVSGEETWHDVTQLTPSSWEFDDTANSRQGDVVYEVRIIDENEYPGNTSKQDVFIDTSAPDVGDLDITTLTDTGADDNITANGNPVLTFTGEDHLEITLNGANGQPLPATAFTVTYSGGIYTVSLLDADPAANPGIQPFGTFFDGTATNNAPNVADGTYTINAKDIAGNSKTVGDFIIDTSAPVIGALDISGPTDTGADDNITANGNPVLTFTGEDDLEITLNGADGQPLPATAFTVTYSGGIYTVSLLDADPANPGIQPFGTFFDGTATNNAPNVADGTYTINAKDIAGNSKTVGDFIIDTSAPVIGALDISGPTDTGADDNITANGNPVLTFTGEDGLEITLNGADGQPLPATAFTVTYSGGIYTVSLLDADPANPGIQPFGTFFDGTATNNAPNVADGTYTINAKDIAGNSKTVGDFIIDTADADLDGDGAQDNIEQGVDGNNDGIPDSEQASVATFETSNGGRATIAVTVVESSSSPDGSLQASTGLFFQGVSADAETSGDIITGLEQAVGAQVIAVSDQPSFLLKPKVVVTGPVDPATQAEFTNSVNQRFSDTIQQVDIFFEEGAQAWNSLFKPDGKGGYFFFGYNPQTGLGGMLLDRNNNNIVDGARLFLKDGELGDLDGLRNGEIQDPVGLAALASTPTLRLSDDSRGLIVDGVAGTGLWLNLEALSANASLQNTLELVTRDGVLLGSVGATANSTNLGSKEIYLEAGQELRFIQSSGNQKDNITPNIRLSSENGGFRLALEDKSRFLGDFNDLVIQITSSLTAQAPNAIVMARLQHNVSDAILDLTAIPAAGTKLNFSILTDSNYVNRFGLVKLAVDPLTGGYAVNGVSAGNSDAFRNAVRDNIINPGGSPIAAGGYTGSTITWNVTSADQGIYAAVLINPNGQVFTFGATGSDGQQHVKVLGDSTFGFEDLLSSQGSDWDFNDFRVQVSFAA